MRTILVAAVLAAGAGAAAAQAKPPEAPKPDLAAELATLTADYEAAEQKFWEPWRTAKTDAEREKLVYDPAKAPAHAYRPRFQDLADRAKGTESALGALLWLFEHPPDEEEAQTKARSATLARILADHLASPALEGLAQSLAWGAGALFTGEGDAALRLLMAKSPHRLVKAAATLSLARVLTEHPGGSEPEIAAKRAEGKALFQAVVDTFGDTPYAAQAKGALFEAEHLQIGMVAPDFASTDQDGKPFKLSDYRGKVVVVDFWGYW